MKIRLGNEGDIEGWMRLVEKVKQDFPGLETEKRWQNTEIRCWTLCAADPPSARRKREKSPERCCSPRKTARFVFWLSIRRNAGGILPDEW